MNKPKFLFHGSPNRDIQVFEPRAETTRHPDEGPVVFAGITKADASKFLVPSDNSWANLGLFNGVHYAVYNDERRFRNLDKGGAIYKLPPDDFSLDEKFDGGKNEWTSKVSVNPISKEILNLD